MHSDHEGWGNLRFHGVKCNPCQVFKAEKVILNGKDGSWPKSCPLKRYDIDILILGVLHFESNDNDVISEWF